MLETLFDSIHFFINRVEVKMSEAIDDMEAFTKLTDGIIHLIGFYPAQSEEIKEVVFLWHCYHVKTRKCISL